MMEKGRDILIIGGGGHAKVILDALRDNSQYRCVGIIDAGKAQGDTIESVPVLGNDDVLPKLFDDGVRHAIVGVGQCQTSSVRKSIFDSLKSIGYTCPSITHPSAVVSGSAQIGEGAFVAAGSVVGPGAIVGDNVTINTGATVDHDCTISNHVFISPGVTLCGQVSIGTMSFIGAGSTVIQSVSIGENVLIGAGTLVLDTIHDHASGFGTPFRERIVTP